MEGSLGKFIRAARERAGLTQQELAAAAYHSVSWVRRIERGETATTTDADAKKLAEELNLTTWEIAYLHLMLGKPSPEKPTADDTAMFDYIDALDPHPAAWISNDGPSHSNSAFRDLLPDVETAPYVGAWFFTPPAKAVIVNWLEVADWWISDAKFRIVSDDHDHFFANLVDRLGDALPDFRERWDANVIPGNPEPPIWLVRTGDGTITRVAMRAWWQSNRHGLLIQGVIQH